MSATWPICPFCRTRFTESTGFTELCGGSFTDRAHPSAVRPVLVEVEADGRLRAGEEARLAEARDTYRAGR